MIASPWTDERVSLLRKLRCLEGLSCGQIAKALSMTGHRFTRNSVIAKCDRLGIEAPVEVRAQRNQQRAKIEGRRPKPVGWRKPTKPPELKPSPFTPRAPTRGPNSVRFIARTSSQCPLFVEGEQGAEGFVCGEPVTHGSWCANCSALVYTGHLAGERLVA